MKLRPMTVADIDLVLLYEEVMFGTEAWSRAAYLEEITDTELRHYLVAESDDGEILGDGGLLTIAETAQIVTVGVFPHARRQGVGRILVRALVDEARRRQADEVLLEVRVDNDAAQKLYDSEGFSMIGTRKGYYDHGRVDAVVMRLGLS
jgi:[ribosomal protein S18]-alanine N-acetyltransferase